MWYNLAWIRSWLFEVDSCHRSGSVRAWFRIMYATWTNQEYIKKKVESSSYFGVIQGSCSQGSLRALEYQHTYLAPCTCWSKELCNFWALIKIVRMDHHSNSVMSPQCLYNNHSNLRFPLFFLKMLFKPRTEKYARWEQKEILKGW